MTEINYPTDLIERGRLMFARPILFTKGCVSLADLPPMDRVEIAFAGRSNVGKSSLINALCGTSIWRAPPTRRAVRRNSTFLRARAKTCASSTCPAMAMPRRRSRR